MFGEGRGVGNPLAARLEDGDSARAARVKARGIRPENRHPFRSMEKATAAGIGLAKYAVQ